MHRIIDISSDGIYLHISRGFLLIEKDSEEIGRIALDDIGGLITHSHHLTWSNSVFTRLAENKVPVVICAQNHAPIACVWPLSGHHHQGARMNAQANAAKPLKKRLWQIIVQAKIRMQAAILTHNGHNADAFKLLEKRVKSGDPENIEAQAARRYWQPLFGSDFRRDPDGSNINGMLNYGYTVIRATISRSICAAGLHPTLGLHHSNRSNSFALADDLMEPYRPLVDQTVLNLTRQGIETVTPEAKAVLTQLTTLDLRNENELSPLNIQCQKFVHSLAISFENAKASLFLFEPPQGLVLSSLGTD